jgi:hypothetical protein
MRRDNVISEQTYSVILTCIFTSLIVVIISKITACEKHKYDTILEAAKQGIKCESTGGQSFNCTRFKHSINLEE